MGSSQSSSALDITPFEKKRQEIESRRLRPSGSIDVASDKWMASTNLHRGDEIARRIPGGPFKHHGVYLGDGKVCDLLKGKPPAKVSMEEFLSGESSFQVILYDNDRPEAKEDTAVFAIMATEDPSWEEDRYALLTHNCEHFAKFCRIGLKVSTQAKQGPKKAGAKAGVISVSGSISGSIGDAIASVSTSISSVFMYCDQCAQEKSLETTVQ